MVVEIERVHNFDEASVESVQSTVVQEMMVEKQQILI